MKERSHVTSRYFPPDARSRAEIEIEAQLGLMTAAVARCFERSKGDTPSHPPVFKS